MCFLFPHSLKIGQILWSNCFWILNNRFYRLVIPENKNRQNEVSNCPSFFSFQTPTQREKERITVSLAQRGRVWNSKRKRSLECTELVTRRGNCADKMTQKLPGILLNRCLNNPGMLWESIRLDKNQINFWRKTSTQSGEAQLRIIPRARSRPWDSWASSKKRRVFSLDTQDIQERLKKVTYW